MKYKLLLAGKNQTIIDDFFYVMSDEFECLTTSIRNVDIISHINYFKPDAFVYCIAAETRENILKLINALEMVDRKKLKLILIGDAEQCNEFMRLRAELVSLVLLKPITAGVIKAEIIRFFEEQQKQLMEQELEQLQEIEKEKENVKIQDEHEEKEEPAAGDGEVKHILVIDDDPMMLRLIKQELKEKYNVATAVSGKIALNFLKNRKTDLILLDYEMPVENGPEVLKKLRENEETKDIPVVFLTGINDREKIQKVLAMKPQGYLLKPIEYDKLIQTIHNVIG